MRIRAIKPEFWKDEELGARDPLIRLLFIGLWGLADANGVFEDRPLRIQAEVLPYDGETIEKRWGNNGETPGITNMLRELEEGGWIRRFESDDTRYYAIRNWDRHQRITGKEASAGGKHPLPPNDLWKKRNNGETTGKQRGNTRETPGCPGTGNREQGKDKPPKSPLGKGEVMYSSVEEALENQHRKGMTAAKKRSLKLKAPPDERMKLINSCFNRQDTTLWTYYEGEQFVALDPPIEECALMAKFYGLKAAALEKPNPVNYWKTDLDTLLNQWGQQLDRARQMVKAPPDEVRGQSAEEQTPWPEPDGWRSVAAADYPNAKVDEWTWAKLCREYPDVAAKLHEKLKGKK